MKTLQRSTVLLSMIVSALGFADLADQTIQNGNFYGNVNTIQDNVANGTTTSHGLELKLEDARRKADQGRNAANAAGAALTATGAAMMANPLLPVRIAGKILFIKGLTEFKQAKASGDSQDGNDKGKNTLLQNAAQNGKQNTTDDIANKILSPQVQQMLSDRGINPEDFARGAAEGKINDMADLDRALGDPSEYSPDDMAKAEKIAGDELAKSSHENGSNTLARVGHDENHAAGNATTSGAGSGGASGGSLGANGNSAGLAEGLGRSDGRYETNVASYREASESLMNLINKSSDSAAMGMGLNGLGLGQGQEQVSGPNSNAALILSKLGILIPKTRLTIFQIGTRYYRAFHRWTKIRRSLASMNH